MPWKLGHFPCKYLGLQLSIKPLTRSEWQPMVDAALKILPGWQQGMVTRPGRLILVNQVMRARATHHLIVAEAPKWALDRIDSGCRAFFWAGTEEIQRGKCVVSWRRVCRPKYLGGLGVIFSFVRGEHHVSLCSGSHVHAFSCMRPCYVLYPSMYFSAFLLSMQ